MPDYDFSRLRAMFINGTLKPSPEPSHTDGLVQASAQLMRKHGVTVEVLRAVDHDIATGVWPDMTEHGAASDAWPEIFPRVLASDILVVAGPIWLGDNSSVTKRVIEWAPDRREITGPHPSPSPASRARDRWELQGRSHD